ncbi:hypothetical protein E6P09_13180 [Haloferax mediterranei ATCC 33500]|uniref:Uncharacterized protein n=1 Tax=Haloferax mediterranei (strain ATCC 33500 / DSM 1411 / JCM 8866 / NBRC 14739 / NCIMB 2177 / R-4) TaxID=523841 RepID=A0A4P8P6W6_HALMT|nr:hypothetical protein [Haloferax mediterranei]MDX5986847.1 hypothetical protein [Haloferax mediterranei ATCC 33500]QCQ76171.1 hypothetical protein E6P09_13180 [Haloferax mediterranei ATCC 33500]
MSNTDSTTEPLKIGVLGYRFRPTFFRFGAASWPAHRKNLDQKVPRDSAFGLARGTESAGGVTQ